MRLPVLLLAALAALAGCNSEPQSSRSVTNPWIRLPAVAGRPAAGYFMVDAKEDHRSLTGVSSPRAQRIEMHETMTAGSMTKMNKLDRIDLVSGEAPIIFSPGGRHLMLFDLDPALKAGDQANLVFHFDNGSTSTVPARIVGAGDENPYAR